VEWGFHKQSVYFWNKKSERQKTIPKHIFLISRMMNPEIVKFVMESMFGNILKRVIWKSFLKKVKWFFLKMMGCRKPFVGVQGEKALFYTIFLGLGPRLCLTHCTC